MLSRTLIRELPTANALKWWCNTRMGLTSLTPLPMNHIHPAVVPQTPTLWWKELVPARAQGPRASARDISSALADPFENWSHFRTRI